MKPTVSQLLDLLNKPALIKWANKIGLEGKEIDIERRSRLNAGTSIHNQISQFVINQTPFKNKSDQDNYLSFISDKEVLEVENRIETEWFTGIYDMRLKWNNKIYVVDFKNNSKRIYFENKLQLIAYSMGVQCDNLAIISVPSFNIMDFDPVAKVYYEEILICLSRIYTLKTYLHE